MNLQTNLHKHDVIKIPVQTLRYVNLHIKIHDSFMCIYSSYFVEKLREQQLFPSFFLKQAVQSDGITCQYIFFSNIYGTKNIVCISKTFLRKMLVYSLQHSYSQEAGLKEIISRMIISYFHVHALIVTYFDLFTFEIFQSQE